MEPVNYTKSNVPDLNFTFIIGQSLELTDEILGTGDVNFEDVTELTRDFAFFFSSPLGNAADDSGCSILIQMATAIIIQEE